MSEKKFLSSREGARYKEQILDETSGRIERDLEAAQAAREIFADALAGKSVLLVDSVLGKIGKGTKEAVGELHDRGWDELAQLILQKAFGGRIPGQTDFFQRFFGEKIKMDVVDVRKRKTAPEATNIGAFVFSGSPANVSDALSRPKAEVSEGFSHGFVYDATSHLYKKAEAENLPIIGICYGHQTISSHHGAEIKKLPKKLTGPKEMTATDEGRILLAGVLGRKEEFSGKIPVSHGDVVEPNPEHSALFLTTSDTDPKLTHGLIHVPQEAGFPKLTGDGEKDKEIISELLEKRKGVKLTVQAHPELERGDIISFFMSRDIKEFEEDSRHRLGADYLTMFANYLQHFKK